MAASKPSYESLKSKITNYTQKMTKFQMNSQRKIARSGDKLRKHSQRQNGPRHRVLFNNLCSNFSFIITQFRRKKLRSKLTLHCGVGIFNNHSCFSITVEVDTSTSFEILAKFLSSWLVASQENNLTKTIA